MILDGCALRSLHLLPPSDPLGRARGENSNSRHFSLFNTINRCSTAFGRRMLRNWICAPACDKNVLKSRQETITFLASPEAKTLIENSLSLLRKVPDLERLFQRIHTIGLKYRSEKHPDGRAQMLETGKYNARKVKDLVVTLEGKAI